MSFRPAARQFFAARKAAPTPPLPYDAEVEYLESTGTQWIDTGIVPDYNTEVQLRGTIYEAIAGSILAGARTGSTNSNRYFVLGYYNANAVRYCLNSQYTLVFAYNRTLHDIVFNQTGTHAMYFDGELKQQMPSGYSVMSQNALMLFGVSGYEPNHYLTKGIIASCKIIQGGNLVRDLISVRFTNELGQSEGAMYDRVSGRLFRNQGKGAFTIGPDKTSWTNPYVTDGLVAMWDGEWNAGGGVHDQSATAWKDLIGNLDATAIDSPIFGDNYTDTSNGYWTLPSGVREIVETQNLTAEAVFQVSSDAIDANQGIVGLGSSRSLWFFFGGPPLSDSATLNWQVRASLGIRVWYNSGVFGTSVHSSSIVDNDSVCNAYLDSALCTITPNVAAGSATSTSMFFIGRIHGYNKFHGKIYCVRIYSRALTAAEISANYAIDKARFNLP